MRPDFYFLNELRRLWLIIETGYLEKASNRGNWYLGPWREHVKFRNFMQAVFRILTCITLYLCKLYIKSAKLNICFNDLEFLHFQF